MLALNALIIFKSRTSTFVVTTQARNSDFS